jgi:hypothetical protein
MCDHAAAAATACRRKRAGAASAAVVPTGASSALLHVKGMRVCCLSVRRIGVVVHMRMTCICTDYSAQRKAAESVEQTIVELSGKTRDDDARYV